MLECRFSCAPWSADVGKVSILRRCLFYLPYQHLLITPVELMTSLGGGGPAPCSLVLNKIVDFGVPYSLKYALVFPVLFSFCSLVP